jgi:hypothetical protein
MRHVVGDVVERSIRVNTAFLVQEVVDGSPIAQDDNICGTYLQGEDGSVLISPFFKSDKRSVSLMRNKKGLILTSSPVP